MTPDNSHDILALASAGGLDLTAADDAIDDTGMDFVVVHAVDANGAPWIVRSARRDDGREKLEAEKRMLDLVRGRLPVAVPAWRELTPTLIAYPLLGGDPAAVVDLTAGRYVWRFDETAPPAIFIESLGAALAALHGIDREAARAAGIPVKDPLELRVDHARRMANARDVLHVPDDLWARWQAWLADDSYWPERTVPVHGDLHPAHILIDDDHRVTGLLDWTEGHVGDPAGDFTLHYATLGAESLAVLLERYRASGGIVAPRMHEHVAETWSAYPTLIAEFARVTGDRTPLGLAQALIDATGSDVG